MKRLFFLVFPLFFISCEQDIEYQGEVSISGYCYHSCNGTPLGNYQVKFRHEDVVFETYTDSTGYFNLQESYSFFYSPRNFPSSEYVVFSEPQITGLCNRFVLDDLEKFDNDTINFFQQVNTIVSIKIDTNTFSNISDTLFVKFNEEVCGGPTRPLFRSSTQYYSIGYHKYYTGPFQNNQILDTVQTWVSPYVNGIVNSHYTASGIVRGANLNVSSNNLFGYFVNGSQGFIQCGSFQNVEFNLSP